MAAHRYWRVKTFSIPGTYLEISEFQLFDGSTRVDSSATLTAQTAPAGGSLADLKDGNLSTRAYWSDSVVENPAFWLKWDFATSQNVNGAKFGGFDTSTRYPEAFTLEWSDDDSSWTEQGSASGLPYPGNNTLSALIPLVPPTMVSGTVYDSMGAPTARTVRVYRRDNGALIGEDLSDETTGAYAVGCGAYSGEVQVVCLDDDAGTLENDLIHRTYPV